MRRQGERGVAPSGRYIEGAVGLVRPRQIENDQKVVTQCVTGARDVGRSRRTELGLDALLPIVAGGQVGAPRLRWA